MHDLVMILKSAWRAYVVYEMWFVRCVGRNICKDMLDIKILKSYGVTEDMSITHSTLIWGKGPNRKLKECFAKNGGQGKGQILRGYQVHVFGWVMTMKIRWHFMKQGDNTRTRIIIVHLFWFYFFSKKKSLSISYTILQMRMLCTNPSRGTIVPFYVAIHWLVKGRGRPLLDEG